MWKMLAVMAITLCHSLYWSNKDSVWLVYSATDPEVKGALADLGGVKDVRSLSV